MINLNKIISIDIENFQIEIGEKHINLIFQETGEIRQYRYKNQKLKLTNENIRKAHAIKRVMNIIIKELGRKEEFNKIQKILTYTESRNNGRCEE